MKKSSTKQNIKTINNDELRLDHVGQEVTLFGWVHNIRKFKGITFVDLRDRWGLTQLIFKTDNVDFTKESVLQVSGLVQARKTSNPELKTGQIELVVNSFKVLSRAENLPFEIDDKINVSEDLRLTYRYLDLRRFSLRDNLILRHKLIKLCRDYLSSQDFLEVETPLLGRTTPEGARDFLVPTRKSGMFFALPQSPQLYKQLLIASGIERYFQVARVMRDEDLRKDRQFEFTQLDIEKSFTSAEDIKHLIENLLKSVLPPLGFSITTPFARMDYDKALMLYGSDKPDTRFECFISDLPGYNLKNQKAAKRLLIREALSPDQLKFLTEVAQKNGAKHLLWGEKIKSKLNGPLYTTHQYAFQDDLTTGTMLVVIDELHIALKALGAVRGELNNMFNYADTKKLEFLWIENWPLFEIENGVIQAAHHPFTAPDHNSSDFDKHPEQARAQAYDLVLNGFEVAGGSVRINDMSIQRRMFATIGLSTEEANNKFGFFLEAFKYGLPPHAGIAFGLDRLLMILAKATSIRDVIAFPKNAHGNALMEGAPSLVTPEQLEQYSLRIKK